jgi:hypothetical protein
MYLQRFLGKWNLKITALIDRAYNSIPPLGDNGHLTCPFADK